MVNIVFKNRIPSLLVKAGINISDLQRRTGLSYPAALRLGSTKRPVISAKTEIGTLQNIADVLTQAGTPVTVDDLYATEDNGQ